MCQALPRWVITSCHIALSDQWDRGSHTQGSNYENGLAVKHIPRENDECKNIQKRKHLYCARPCLFHDHSSVTLTQQAWLRRVKNVFFPQLPSGPKHLLAILRLQVENNNITNKEVTCVQVEYNCCLLSKIKMSSYDRCIGSFRTGLCKHYNYS